MKTLLRLFNYEFIKLNKDVKIALYTVIFIIGIIIYLTIKGV
jgi:hypothetical protein